MTADGQEYGSNFDLPRLNVMSQASGFPVSSCWFGSGRIAIAELLEWGAQTRGWCRLWIPAYYCEDVVKSLELSCLSIARYSCGPCGKDSLPVYSRGDVLLRVDYFGWGLSPLPGKWSGDVIEDHTHDPLGAVDSKADFVVASLRKTFPIPDGAVCWSPRGWALPPELAISPQHERAVLQRLAAMVQKSVYLSGDSYSKETYRSLELEAENQLLKGHPAPMSAWSHVMIQHLPLIHLRRTRSVNLAAFRTALTGDPLLSVIGPEHQDAPAVAVVWVKHAHNRDTLRRLLAAEAIYTAVLWPVPTGGLPWHRPDDVRFAAHNLAVHVDARYSPADLIRIAYRMRSLAQQVNADSHGGRN